MKSKRRAKLMIEYEILSMFLVVEKPTLHLICKKLYLHPRVAKKYLDTFITRGIIKEIKNNEIIYEILSKKQDLCKYLNYLRV